MKRQIIQIVCFLIEYLSSLCCLFFLLFAWGATHPAEDAAYESGGGYIRVAIASFMVFVLAWYFKEKKLKGTTGRMRLIKGFLKALILFLLLSVSTIFLMGLCV